MKEIVILGDREYYKEIENGQELYNPVKKESYMEENGMRYKLMPMYGTEILVEEWIEEDDLKEMEFRPTEYQVEREKAIKEAMPEIYKEWFQRDTDTLIEYLKEFQQEVNKRKEELREIQMKSYQAMNELAPEGSIEHWKQLNMIEMTVHSEVMTEMVYFVHQPSILKWLDRNSIFYGMRNFKIKE